MNNINIQLDLLIEVLEKKITNLEEIKVLSDQQGELLDKENVDFDMFNELIIQKQTRIDKIIEIDDGFKSIFENIKTLLESQPSLYKSKIEQMKKYIKTIGELGVAITVKEERNRMNFMVKSKDERSKIKEYRINKKNVASYYSNVNRQNGADQSFFFDSKK